MPDSCAFQPACNAGAAYAISAQGATFSPGAVYDGTGYTRYLGAAQTAVTGLDSGALVSAAFGVCATRSARPLTRPWWSAPAGGAGRPQQWTITGGTLRSGTFCLAAAGNTQPTVTASACTGDASQTWTAQGPGELKNAGTGQCLRDPNSNHTAGTQADPRVVLAHPWQDLVAALRPFPPQPIGGSRGSPAQAPLISGT